MNISDTAKSVIVGQTVEASFPFLIHISHEEFGNMYFSNSNDDIWYNGKTYKKSFFKVNFDEQTVSKFGGATLEMSSIDQDWIKKIRSTSKRATVEFVGIISYEGNAYDVEPLFTNSFYLSNATWNDITISWTLLFDDKWDIKVPCELCDNINAPGVA